MAAFGKQGLWMCFLKVTAADFRGRNLRCDRQDRRAAAMSIEQSIDEVQIAWPAGARTDSQFTGDLRFTGRSEGRRFLMPNVDPGHVVMRPQGVGEAVEAV